MTRPDAQVPPPAPSATEVEYVRKLSLAILSTLQAKGMLSVDEVDAILIAARRAAQGVPASPASTASSSPAAPSAPRPAAAPTMQVTVQPATTLSFHPHARTPQVEADVEAALPDTARDAPEESAPAAEAASPEFGERPTAEEPQATEPSGPSEPLTVEAPASPTALGPDTVEEGGTVLPAALDPRTPDAPDAQAAEAPAEGPDARPAPPQVTEPEVESLDSVEPPAQTIVIGPDEVQEAAEPDPPAPADDLVLDSSAEAKPNERARTAVPTFDLKLD